MNTRMKKTFCDFFFQHITLKRYDKDDKSALLAGGLVSVRQGCRCRECVPSVVWTFLNHP